MRTYVKTQAELDAAIRVKASDIIISGGGGWLTVSGSATVRASGSATVAAYGSATVRAYGSATVAAYDSATVTAYDSATVAAYGSATVRAYDHVAVHRHSKRAKVAGGVLIDVSGIDLSDTAQWLDYHGVKVSRGSVTLYKALPDDMTSGRAYGPPITWTVNSTLTAADYNDRNECGGGLHVSPSTHHATAYLSEATRWVAVKVKVADITPITGGTAKCKVRACKVLHEVNRDGVKL